jgi:sarcosine oxidase subunit alpha
MTERVTISVNGKPISVPSGTIVAAAIALAGETRFRRGVQGGARGPFCGMGVCFECRVTINGEPHARSCLLVCADGMEVRTDE